MAKDCGCRPCKKPIPNSNKICKPFTICVGNKSLIWNGECLSVQDRKYQIPDGTYTSITFTGGCITDVGQAPLPIYTPQACCDGDGVTGVEQPTGTNATASNTPGNLATVINGAITVKPLWEASDLDVKGSGTADKPWRAKLRLSKQQGNILESTSDGLYASIHVSGSSTINVEGSGSAADPFKFNLAKPDVNLPDVGKEILGNGYTINRQGLFIVEDQGLEVFTTNDLPRMRELLGVIEPKFEFNEENVTKILDVVGKSETLKQKLKTMLGV